MSASLGRVTARLAEPAETAEADLVHLINENINPPDPVTEAEVYIRAMYVTSDQVNSFGGCFPAVEHPCLAELLIDSPVMVGHRKDKLPIGRTFHAVVVERDGLSWVKAYFYWLKSAEGAHSLAENVDGGIYKECSVGFTFLLPECSICGKDIRRCQHEPFERYEVDGKAVVCHYNYRKLERVLETSLVYRGAAPGTSITRELALTQESVLAPVKLADLSFLPDADRYLVMPHYEGIEVRVAADRDRLKIVAANESSEESVRALLVGYRGKERRSVKELTAFLDDRSGPVTRVELKLYPSDETEALLSLTPPDGCTVHAVRYRECDRDNLSQTAAALATREGVRIRLGDRTDQIDYLARVPAPTTTDRSYRLHLLRNDRARLTFIEPERERSLLIRQFSQARLMKGARFVAETLAKDYRPEPAMHSAGGTIINLSRMDESFVMELTGTLCGRFALQPIRLHGRERLLFYRLIDGERPTAD